MATKGRKETTKILSCSCQHEFQDEKYGRSRRVFNRAISKAGGTKWRCTVCLREVNLP